MSGPPQCHNKTVDIGLDSPEEVCDLQPQKMCKQVYRLVPKLYPQEICEEVPREVKTVHVYTCVPVYLYTFTALFRFASPVSRTPGR